MRKFVNFYRDGLESAWLEWTYLKWTEPNLSELNWLVSWTGLITELIIELITELIADLITELITELKWSGLDLADLNYTKVDRYVLQILLLNLVARFLNKICWV